MAPTATLGLTSYRWNNQAKSIALLAVFPVLLLVLLGGVFFIFGLIANSGEPNPYPPSSFQMFGLQSVLGSGSAADLGVSAMGEYWPGVLGVAAIWVAI